MIQPEDRPIRVELRVRDLTPAGLQDRQQAVYEELQALREAERVDEVTVEVWGTQVPVTGGDGSSDPDRLTGAACSRYRAFESWAEAQGYELEPAFSRCRVPVPGGGDAEVVRLPAVCLAVYGAGELLEVVPCTTDEGVRTVRDCLEALWTVDERPAAGTDEQRGDA